MLFFCDIMIDEPFCSVKFHNLFKVVGLMFVEV